MMRAIQMAVACVAVLVATAGQVHASLIVNVVGLSGSGQTTWTLSGSSTVNQSGTIRTSSGSSNFSLDDTFEPDSPFSGNWLLGALHNTNVAVTGTPTIEIGAESQTITHIFLDQDPTRDDFGIRTASLLSYSPGETTSWSGAFTTNLDIDNFQIGTFKLVGSQTNGGGFLFAQPGDVELTFSQTSAVPEPSSLAVFGIGACVAGVGAARRRRREKQQGATA